MYLECLVKFSEKRAISAVKNLLDGWGEMRHLQLVLLLGYVIDCVLGRKLAGELGNDFAAVADGGNVVDGEARFGVAGSLHCLVDVVTPHALAAMAREECRVEIDDALREGLDEVFGHERQETRQHDELNAVLRHQRHKSLRVIELCLRHNGRWNAELLGTHQSIGIGAVAHYERHAIALAVSKAFKQTLAVGTASRNKYCYVYHKSKCITNAKVRFFTDKTSKNAEKIVSLQSNGQNFNGA